MADSYMQDLYFVFTRIFMGDVLGDPGVRLAVLAIGAFAGAFVAGVAGFGFSAAAGAAVMHVMDPARAIPFLMLCSIVVQVIGLLRLRASVDFRSSGCFVLGGLVGAPMAVWLLTHLDAAGLRAGFGMFLLAYTGHTYVGIVRARRPVAVAGQPRLAVTGPEIAPASPSLGVASCGIGLLSGLIGGLTAMPGAVLSAWCDGAGLSKERQRGLVQPFILTMQITALAWMVAAGEGIDGGLLADMLWTLPALLAGVALGLAVYARMNASVFRQMVLAMIAASGVALTAY